jgi:hypothetical protein
MKEFPHLLKWIDRIAEVRSEIPEEIVADFCSALLSRAELRSHGRTGKSSYQRWARLLDEIELRELAPQTMS